MVGYRGKPRKKIRIGIAGFTVGSLFLMSGRISPYDVRSVAAASRCSWMKARIVATSSVGRNWAGRALRWKQ